LLVNINFCYICKMENEKQTPAADKLQGCFGLIILILGIASIIFGIAALSH